MVLKANNNYIRYLSVTLDPKLNWNAHIIDYNVTTKGNFTFGFIQRSILTNSEAVKNMVGKQLIRPVFEYASASFWDSTFDNAVTFFFSHVQRSYNTTAMLRTVNLLIKVNTYCAVVIVILPKGIRSCS